MYHHKSAGLKIIPHFFVIMKEKEKIKYLLCSDFHLGSKVCQSNKILELLNKYDFETLIFAGDLIDSYHLQRLSKEHWKVLGELRKISKKHECIWIVGNHDVNEEIISILLGFEFVKDYKFNIKNKSFYVIHGDKFDNFVHGRPLLTEIASFFYYNLQKIDRKQRVSRWVKSKSKTWIGAARKMSDNLISYGRNNGYDVIIAGHSHIPEIYHKDDICYINCGSQCEIPCTHVIIFENGEIELKEIL